MATDKDSTDELGRIVELEVTNVAHGGVFVARQEGRVVFVPDTAPGEVVRARITEASHATFHRAEVLEVLQSSPHRVPHIWDAASLDVAPESRPGGAEFGHLEVSYQRDLKHEVLADAMRRMANAEPDFEVLAPAGESPDGSGWRTRVRLHVGDDGAVGPYAARSHRVVRVQTLPLGTHTLNAAAPLQESYAPRSVVDVVAPAGADPFVLVSPPAAQASSARRRDRDRRRGARSRRPAPAASRREDAAPRQTILERVGDREFALDARGFWQVHRLAPLTIGRGVQELLARELLDPEAWNLDLYGGVGLLAAALGEAAGPALRVTSVESDAVATSHAARNLRDWVAASAVTGRVDQYLAEVLRTAPAAQKAALARGTFILDPPRAGAGREVIASIAELAPSQLIYVACDPVALARDTALLYAHGYRLRALRGLDLFPNTHHLEAVAAFAQD